MVIDAHRGLPAASICTQQTSATKYSSSESHAEFYGYQTEVPPNATGLVDAGVNCAAPAHATYVFFHEATTTGSLAMGLWHAGLTDQQEPRSQVRTVFEGGADALATPPVVQDDPPGGGQLGDDLYETTAVGDPVTEHFYSRRWGDGVVYRVTDRDAQLRLRFTDITAREATDPNPEHLFVSTPAGCIDATSGAVVEVDGGPTVAINNELPTAPDDAEEPELPPPDAEPPAPPTTGDSGLLAGSSTLLLGLGALALLVLLALGGDGERQRQPREASA